MGHRIPEKAGQGQDQAFLPLPRLQRPALPHSAPEDWLRKVQKREPQLDLKRATSVAFVEHMDHEIGKVLDAVEELGIARDTLITFSSDNGGSVPHAATNEPWRGGKQEHWEGGIRVPTCAVWPGTIPVGQSDELGITMDLLPTFAEIAGVPVENEIEGKSLVPIWLQGKRETLSAPSFGSDAKGTSAIRGGPTTRYGRETGNSFRIIPSSRCNWSTLARIPPSKIRFHPLTRWLAS